VLPATLLRGLTTCAGRRQILGGMFCVESSRSATAFRAAADWRSLEGSLKILLNGRKTVLGFGSLTAPIEVVFSA
jgi:hypothetical protein